MAPPEPWWGPILAALLDILTGRAFAAGQADARHKQAQVDAAAQETADEILRRPLGTDDAIARLRHRAQAELQRWPR